MAAFAPIKILFPPALDERKTAIALKKIRFPGGLTPVKTTRKAGI